MDRYRIFMLSYIAFMITSIIIKSFCDYRLWNNIVVAVTISGVLFAYAEMFKTIYEDCKRIKDKRGEYFDSMLKKSKNINTIITNILSRGLNSEDEQHYKCELAINQENIEHLKKMKEINHNNKVVKLSNIMYLLFLFLAFFLLLCIIVFEPLAQKLIKVQNYATVIAFILILSTPFLSDLIRWINRKSDDLEKKLEDSTVAIEDFYKKELEHHAN